MNEGLGLAAEKNRKIKSQQSHNSTAAFLCPDERTVPGADDLRQVHLILICSARPIFSSAAHLIFVYILILCSNSECLQQNSHIWHWNPLYIWNSQWPLINQLTLASPRQLMLLLSIWFAEDEFSRLIQMCGKRCQRGTFAQSGHSSRDTLVVQPVQADVASFQLHSRK